MSEFDENHAHMPADLLARIDERTRAIQRDVNALRLDLDGLKQEFVTEKEFWPVRAIAYGLVGLILVSVIGAIVTMVLRSR